MGGGAAEHSPTELGKFFVKIWSYLLLLNAIGEEAETSGLYLWKTEELVIFHWNFLKKCQNYLNVFQRFIIFVPTRRTLRIVFNFSILLKILRRILIIRKFSTKYWDFLQGFQEFQSSFRELCSIYATFVEKFDNV